MKVVAYSAKDWRDPVRWATKVDPYLSPPHGMELDSELPTRMLQEAAESDLFFIRLHGYMGKPDYYGQSDDVHSPRALTPEIVSRHSWHGVIVFAEVCFSAHSHPQNRRMPEAFLDNGCLAFIGSVDEVYGRKRPTILDGEGDLLARHFINCYRKERDHLVAWALALGRFALLSIPLDEDDRATIRNFRVLEAV